MAAFNFFDTGVSMSSVRTIINNNFKNALPIPIGTSAGATNIVAIIPGTVSGTSVSTYTIPVSNFIAATNSVSLSGTLTTSGNTQVKGNLIVNGTTTLGDATNDTITLKGTVSAAGVNATFNNISANSINVDSFTVANAAYKAFSASTTAPATNLLWIDTTNASVPILKCCIDNIWVSIGAVFG